MSARQRAWFVVALITFGLASFYTAIGMLTRVTPALFPGKELDLGVFSPVQRGLEGLPGPLKVSAPGTNSVFNRRINLLIIGVDKRAGQGDDATPANTDVIMIATIDPVSSVVSLVSFPRDLWVDIHVPGQPVHKGRINTSYAEGILASGKKGDDAIDAGARQVFIDMKANFGIDLDYWLWMDFASVEGVIDELGGVDVYIPQELKVPWDGSGSWYYSQEDGRPARYLRYDPGPHHFTGYDAVAFGRYREDSDLYRVKRQQVVFQAVMDKVITDKILDRNAFDLWSTYGKYFHHNVPLSKWPGYVGLLRDGAGHVQFYSVGDEVNGRPTVFYATIGGASVLTYDAQNVQYILNQAFTPPKFANSSVEIQNGVGDDGTRISMLGQYLKLQKFLPEVRLGNDVAPQAKTSIILYTEARRPMAEELASWLGLPASAIRTATKDQDNLPDVMIVAGSDLKVPGT